MVCRSHAPLGRAAARAAVTSAWHSGSMRQYIERRHEAAGGARRGARAAQSLDGAAVTPAQSSGAWACVELTLRRVSQFARRNPDAIGAPPTSASRSLQHQPRDRRRCDSTSSAARRDRRCRTAEVGSGPVAPGSCRRALLLDSLLPGKDAPVVNEGHAVSLEVFPVHLVRVSLRQLRVVGEDDGRPVAAAGRGCWAEHTAAHEEIIAVELELGAPARRRLGVVADAHEGERRGGGEDDLERNRRALLPGCKPREFLGPRLAAMAGLRDGAPLGGLHRARDDHVASHARVQALRPSALRSCAWLVDGVWEAKDAGTAWRAARAGEVEEAPRCVVELQRV
mmetsp:Transcript_17194/g.53191  ORF Transcript_17194/g.53191 Transcript_17194/m.53191 type:complete len:339 (-) Transcript_17194:2478-3494(-)